MKIAYVTDQVLPQNATDTIQLVSMASAFGSIGVDVDLVTPEKYLSKPPSQEIIANYYEVARTFRLNPLRSLYPSQRGIEKVSHAVVSAFCKAIRDADVVYSRNIPIVISALQLSKTPVIYETYRPWPSQRKNMGLLFRWMGQKKNFAGAVLHSKLAANSYLASGIPEQKVLVAHNGYNPLHMEPVMTKQQARQKCNLKTNAKIVVYTGRIDVEKGIGFVLDMATRMPDVQFVFIGSKKNGPIEQRAQSIQNATMHKWMSMSDALPYLYAADVLLIPPSASPLEKAGTTVLPIKIFSYMASRRPILAPESPDMKELLIDNDNAALVPPDDLIKSVNRLSNLLKSETEQKRIAEKAMLDVQALTWENRAKNIKRFINQRLSVC